MRDKHDLIEVGEPAEDKKPDNCNTFAPRYNCDSYNQASDSFLTVILTFEQSWHMR